MVTASLSRKDEKIFYKYYLIDRKTLNFALHGIFVHFTVQEQELEKINSWQMARGLGVRVKLKGLSGRNKWAHRNP